MMLYVSVRREINIMRQLCHPRLVRLFEVIDTQSHIYMVMEYMSSGDLFNHLAANILHEDVARHFFQQVSYKGFYIFRSGQLRETKL